MAFQARGATHLSALDSYQVGSPRDQHELSIPQSRCALAFASLMKTSSSTALPCCRVRPGHDAAGICFISGHPPGIPSCPFKAADPCMTRLCAQLAELDHGQRVRCDALVPSRRLLSRGSASGSSIFGLPPVPRCMKRSRSSVT